MANKQTSKTTRSIVNLEVRFPFLKIEVHSCFIYFSSIQSNYKLSWLDLSENSLSENVGSIVGPGISKFFIINSHLRLTDIRIFFVFAGVKYFQRILCKTSNILSSKTSNIWWDFGGGILFCNICFYFHHETQSHQENFWKPISCTDFSLLIDIAIGECRCIFSLFLYGVDYIT